MTLNETDDTSAEELASLHAKINAMLPPRYVGCFEDVPPQSMGSAGLKYDSKGRVAWGEIWTTYCHLALAGGPPHRGRLLTAVSTREAESQPTKQEEVVAEIRRALRLSSDLPTVDESNPGWVAIQCHDDDMAAWLVRAVVAENVSARHEGAMLYVPAGPSFRMEKEIKNVVVSVAKSCHYLLDHVGSADRPRGFESGLIQPPLPDEIESAPEVYQASLEELTRVLHEATGLEIIPAESPGWLGMKCDSEEMAVWIMRAILALNSLARRENDVVFVPVVMGEESNQTREKLTQIVARAMRCWRKHCAAES